MRSTALIDYMQVNCSIHTESSAAPYCAASRRKFETRAIRVAKWCAVLRGTALIMKSTWFMNSNFFLGLLLATWRWTQKVNRVCLKNTKFYMFPTRNPTRTAIERRQHGSRSQTNYVWKMNKGVSGLLGIHFCIQFRNLRTNRPKTTYRTATLTFVSTVENVLGHGEVHVPVCEKTRRTCAKTEFNVKWPFKVIQGLVFCDQWKGDKGTELYHIISMLALFPKVPKM